MPHTVTSGVHRVGWACYRNLGEGRKERRKGERLGGRERDRKEEGKTGRKREEMEKEKLHCYFPFSEKMFYLHWNVLLC